MRNTDGGATAVGVAAAGAFFFTTDFFVAGFLFLLLDAPAELDNGMLRAREEMSPSTKTLRNNFCMNNPFGLMSSRFTSAPIALTLTAHGSDGCGEGIEQNHE